MQKDQNNSIRPDGYSYSRTIATGNTQDTFTAHYGPEEDDKPEDIYNALREGVDAQMAAHQARISKNTSHLKD